MLCVLPPGMKLSTDQSLKVIGDLYDVIRSYVCIEKLAPFLERRRIIDSENCRYFVSQSALTPDFETQKLNALVTILKKVAKYPSGDCVKRLYLSLWDVYEHHDFAGAQHHRDVALYLRKRGKLVITASLSTVIT